MDDGCLFYTLGYDPVILYLLFKLVVLQILPFLATRALSSMWFLYFCFSSFFPFIFFFFSTPPSLALYCLLTLEEALQAHLLHIQPQ